MTSGYDEVEEELEHMAERADVFRARANRVEATLATLTKELEVAKVALGVACGLDHPEAQRTRADNARLREALEKIAERAGLALTRESSLDADRIEYIAITALHPEES